MKERAISNFRKWFSLITAIILYYVIHEGSHVIVAQFYGAFEKIRILGLGVQVVANTSIIITLIKVKANKLFQVILYQLMKKSGNSFLVVSLHKKTFHQFQ